MGFSSLRKERDQQLAKLAEASKNQTNKTSQDERFWRLTVDPKTKNGSAVIRFLPRPEGEDLPFVRTFTHTFQGPGSAWYFENCPTTLDGKGCPVCTANRSLWATGTKENKDLVSSRKRRTNYISNILVIKDHAHPENNGKHFLFRYGPKIYDMLKGMYEPEFPDQKPVDPFNFWSGCDFNLRSHLENGFQSYNKSTFAAPSEILNGDEAAQKDLYDGMHSLTDFVSPEKFKSYDELQARFDDVLTGAQPRRTAADDIATEQRHQTPTAEDVTTIASQVTETEKPKRKVAPGSSNKPSTTKPTAKPTPNSASPKVDDDAELDAYFNQLGEDDE